MAKTIYYKVVKHDLTSMTVNEQEYRIQYKINKWVEPQIKGSFIFIFKTFDAAKACIHHNGWFNYKIYECYAKISKTKKPIYIHTAFNFYKFIKAAKLRLQHQKYTHILDGTPPNGTVFANSIKLIKEV